jgi:hypothetical protein
MPTITAAQSVFTYQDAVDRLLLYTNQNGSQASVSAVKQAVLDAYDDLVNDRNWRYFNRSYRLQQEEPETGTCYYTASTGEFTIDSGSWPTWAERAVIEIDNVRYFIKTRSSSTVLVADDTMRPSANIVTGTAFTIYKCVYQLPMDFRRLHRPLSEQADNWTDYCDFSGWFNMIRYRSSAGFPSLFAVSGDPYEPVRQVLLINPTSDADQTLDLSYQRYARTLDYDGHASHCRVGTITASNSTSVTGSSTTFESGMVGAILRYGRTTTTCPDGRGGQNPYKQQVYISAYSSATAITLHEAINVSGVYYTISDPIDLDRGMMDAFWLGCKHKLAQTLGLSTKTQAERDYMVALRKARGSDVKTTISRSAWGVSPGSNPAIVRNAIQQVEQDS